jgi:hypothetical protein
MSWELVTLFGILIIGILLIIFRNTTFVKSNWKYFIILAPLAILLILKIISDLKSVDTTKPSSGDKPNDDTSKSIENLKDKLVEVQMETAIEISAAKTKNEETIKQLEGIKQIADTSERRKRLAAMIG